MYFWKLHSSCSAFFPLPLSTPSFDSFLGHALEDATLCKAGYVCKAGAPVCSGCWNPSQTGYSRWAEQSESFLYLYRVVRLIVLMQIHFDTSQEMSSSHYFIYLVCRNLIMNDMPVSYTQMRKKPNISFHCLNSWTLTGESWNLEGFQRGHFLFNNMISPSCDNKSKSIVWVCVLCFFPSADSCTGLAD